MANFILKRLLKLYLLLLHPSELMQQQELLLKAFLELSVIPS